jgi:hypothetical protein
MGIIMSFFIVGMGLKDFTITKGGQKAPYSINGFVRINIHEHHLRNNPFRGNIWPPS